MPFANSDSARVGDLCFAIGNPFGQDHTVTMGIVSAKNRHLEMGAHIQNFIQTDASINPGNSGGALINARGELIGMNTMILTGGGGNMFGGGEGGNVGIGFAVPSNLAKQVMDQIEKNGKVSRGYLGAELGSVTQEMAPHLGLKAGEEGAYIASVTPNGPGAKAGLQSGDVVTGIDGRSIHDSDDLTMSVISHSPGSSVTLDIVRNGQPMKLNVTLGTRPTGIDWDQNGPRGGSNNGTGNDQDNGNAGAVTERGITVETLTPDLAQQVNAPTGTKGVVVDSVDESSPAADSVARGTIIIAVDRKPVTNAADFKRLMSQAAGKSVMLTVKQGGANFFVVVQPQ
jgi:serine protease Do